MSFRRLKIEVLSLLRQADLAPALQTIAAMPARQVINPLFGLLYHTDLRVRWHTITAMGTVVAGLADHDLEAARVIVRRLMWNLNDESGGIGWGSPEAMGEILARHTRLAEEYAPILISYIDPQGNFLEHATLQQGALWAVGRLARSRPQRVQAGAPLLLPFIGSSDNALRGLAVWAAIPFEDTPLTEAIRPLRSDPSIITLFSERRLVQTTIAELASAAVDTPNSLVTGAPSGKR
ncbi:MAG: hypothetical protein VR64_19985 [Desulfatitalea sp. BRH_c12]|nr:MAG: hypothetical protein VR64_19985 [Desulfatitalea sp. BRH_c12]